MNFLEELTLSPGEELVQQTSSKENNAGLIKDFKLAIAVLIGVSAVVRLLIHFFVPGM